MYSHINFLYLLAVLSTFYVLYSVVTLLLDRRNAKALGCQPVHVQKNRLPLGWDLLQRLKAADKAGTLPEDMAHLFRETGHRTFRASMLGSTFLNTVEPKNIQALLATQFRDFELGDLRRKTFFPMLGNGIFTADGKYWCALPCGLDS